MELKEVIAKIPNIESVLELSSIEHRALYKLYGYYGYNLKTDKFIIPISIIDMHDFSSNDDCRMVNLGAESTISILLIHKYEISAISISSTVDFRSRNPKDIPDSDRISMSEKTNSIRFSGMLDLFLRYNTVVISTTRKMTYGYELLERKLQSEKQHP